MCYFYNRSKNILQNVLIFKICNKFNVSIYIYIYWALLWPEIENVFKNGEGHLLLLAIDRSSVPKKCITVMVQKG